jgi:hypothetical protein
MLLQAISYLFSRKRAQFWHVRAATSACAVERGTALHRLEACHYGTTVVPLGA